MQEWTKLNCPAPRAPQNGVSFIFEDGLKVQYRCHPGFIMKGRQFSVCRHNKWDSPPPYCVHARTFEDPMSTPDKVAVSSSRTRFNWEIDGMEPKHISIRYGNGSNRLPLINGLWKHPSTHSDSRVLSVVLDSSLPHSIPPEQLVDQEVAIAKLRQKVEQEVKSSRHITDKNDHEKKLNHPYYPPLYANADGFVLGISNSNQHPVYHLGSLADWNNYHTSRYLEPEMVELRRKQIEEARNIQMSAAHKRQQNKFNNIVTYSSRDIPVWQSRIRPKNRYGNEQTVYKSTRVETNRQKSSDLSKSATMEYEMKTINQPKSSFTKVNEEKFPTEMPKILKINTIPLLTEDVVIPTIPAPLPLSEVFDLEQSENNTSVLPQTFILPSTNKRIELEMTKKPDPLEWPPEALWFKQTVTSTPKPSDSYRIPVFPKQKSKKNKFSRRKSNNGSSRKKNGQKSHPAPAVIFSHGRVKSTNPKNLRTK